MEKIKKEAHTIKGSSYKLTVSDELLKKIDLLRESHPNTNSYNTLTFVSKYLNEHSHAYYMYIYEADYNTRLNVNGVLVSDARISINNFKISNKKKGYVLISFLDDDVNLLNANVDYYDDGEMLESQQFSNSTLWFSTLCVSNYKEFLGWYPNYKNIKEVVNVGMRFFRLKAYCDGSIVKPTIPWQPPEDTYLPPENTQSDNENKHCSNTGQFGGGGTPLKDIKLFLYANKVTKGTITLSKPQVEVGTYATDWRPNPADATKRIEMMLKQIESVRKGGRKNGKKRD